jgi:hypothetical protein
MRKWWAVYRNNKVGPCSSREEAAATLLAQLPKLKDAMTGYGEFGPHFDIQWVKREAA